MKKTFFRLGGLFLFPASLFLFGSLGLDPSVSGVLAVALLMVFWWISEAVSIYVTALLPMILFPLLGIMSIQQTTINYGNNVIFLFFGGFLLAKALEKWNLHRRIALSILNITGTGPRKIILGTMLATAALSMWISNTATAMMMLPIALSVVNLFLQNTNGGNTNGPETGHSHRNFATVMMLSVAYGANIGGIATLVGTPPNTVMAGILENTFDYQVGFSNWMLTGVPFSVLLLIGSYFLTVHLLLPVPAGSDSFSTETIRTELKALGKMSSAEKRVALVFSFTAVLWIFRQQLAAIPALDMLSDTQIAIAGALLLYLIPANTVAGVPGNDYANVSVTAPAAGIGNAPVNTSGNIPAAGPGNAPAKKEKKALLEWSDAQGIPWGILLLFGGGLALAAGMETTGILERTADYFSARPVSNNLLMVGGLSFGSVFLSELVSNTALATIMVPLAGSIATGLGMHPIELAAPVTIAASAAFMLPMGTPPNAIVFASGHISIAQMVKAGFFLNLLAVILITIFARFVMPYCFGF